MTRHNPKQSTTFTLIRDENTYPYDPLVQSTQDKINNESVADSDEDSQDSGEGT
jgi:hypothetical protein